MRCRTQYFFEFDAPFFINEDIELLKLMGLDTVGVEEASQWLPADLLDHMPSLTAGGAAATAKQPRPPTANPRQRRLTTFNGAPPHLIPQRPMSDTHYPYHGTQQQPPSGNNLSRRFRETLSSFADFGSSPVI